MSTSVFTAVVRRLRIGQALGTLGAFLLHCRWVLLNGRSVPYRLWTVLVGAFPPILWTLCFKQAKHIPTDIRPPINIHLLPVLNHLLLSFWGILLLTLFLIPLARCVYFWAHGDREPVLRGRGRDYAVAVLAFPSCLWISAKLGEALPTDALDLLAFSTYGALHFASAIIAGWWIWGFGVQGAASTFGWTLGAQNLAGLATHLLWPNASPWFYDVYGVNAAVPDYTYPGNPAGLIRVDRILGTHIYAKAFGAGPVVFGAIPSLHAATAICCSLYVCRYSKGYRGLVFMVVYCGIMFWSTQYFHHHFAIDLLFGTLYSVISFTLFERLRLRKLDLHHYSNGLTNGWDRLRWARQDGENFTAYGERQVAMLSGAGASGAFGLRLEEEGREGEKMRRTASSGSSSSGGSLRMQTLRGGYEHVPGTAGGDGTTVFDVGAESDEEDEMEKGRSGHQAVV